MNLNNKNIKLKNKNIFLYSINYIYIYNYPLKYSSILKNFYFLIIYKFFIQKYVKLNYKKKKFKLFKNKKFNLKLKNNNFIVRKYNFLKKFSIFNFYYLNFNRRFFIKKNTYLKVFPKYRNLFLLFYTFYYKRIWSIGLFVNRLKFKYKVSTQRAFIGYFFRKIQKKFTKNIILYTPKFTNKFIIYMQQLKKSVNYLNKKMYKYKFAKIIKFIFLIKFRTFEKKGKVRPRKKKAMLKKYYKYRY